MGDGESVLAAAGATGTGVVVGDSPTATLQQVQDLLGLHRVWDRFPA
ncbi:hypothetical protein [Pseudonocardia parietis]|uniref:Large catalase C-terminal domain-containing protein n=1 Tax=Pseudonocardia parietis TaxID=570936 RepID=A0ABS4W6F0_9PSEU|nr:hypothetical protein [Pseudonocardia parietis]MBP2371779.1 hypothetical protein [Pseudonocardia parietis]